MRVKTPSASSGFPTHYLGLIDRPDLFASAEYFQIHNHDALVIYDKSANPKPRQDYPWRRLRHLAECVR